MSGAAPGARARATIGILGGGQLGRMLALAAARLGFKCHVFRADPRLAGLRRRAPRRPAPTTPTPRRSTASPPTSTSSPTSSRTCRRRPRLSWRRACRCCPIPKVLATTQDRLAEKNFVAGLGIGTAPFAPMSTRRRRSGRRARPRSAGRPCSRRAASAMTARARQRSATAPIPRRRGARSAASPASSKRSCRSRAKSRSLPRAGSDGPGRMLRRRPRTSTAITFLKSRACRPHCPRRRRDEARRIAETIARQIRLCRRAGGRDVRAARRAGAAGQRDRAARAQFRPLDLDGASVSQFEQHIRAVAGWPLAKPIRHGRVEMINLIGDEVEDIARWLTVPGAAVHLYGKTAVRPGRKMGHVTRVFAE